MEAKTKRISHSEYSIVELTRALRATRQESGGIPLKEVASIIESEFSECEIEILTKYLKVDKPNNK